MPVEFLHADGTKEVFEPSPDTLQFLRSATGLEVPVIEQRSLSDEGAASLYRTLQRETQENAARAPAPNGSAGRPSVSDIMGGARYNPMGQALREDLPGAMDAFPGGAGVPAMPTNGATAAPAARESDVPLPRTKPVSAASPARMRGKSKRARIFEDAAQSIMELANKLPVPEPPTVSAEALRYPRARQAAEDYGDPGMLDPASRTPARATPLERAAPWDSGIQEERLRPFGEPPMPPEVPDLGDQIMRENMRAERETSWTGEAKSALAAFTHGFAQASAGVPKSIAILGGQDVMTTLRDFDRIDRGEKPAAPMAAAMMPMGGGFAAALPQLQIIEDYQKASPEERAKMRAWLETRRDPRGHSLFQMGSAFEEMVKETIPTDPAYEGRFSQKLGHGGGSMVAFLLGAILTRGSPMLGGAGLGAAMNASSQFEQALESGASLDDAFSASNIGALVGTTEVIPILGILSRIDKGSGGVIRRAFINGLKSGTEEAIQESFVSIMDNLIASDLVGYDKARGIFEGTGDAAAVGFTLGDLFATVGTLIAGRRAPHFVQHTEYVSPKLKETPESAPETPAEAPPVAAEAPEVAEPPAAPESPPAPPTEPPAAPEAPAPASAEQDVPIRERLESLEEGAPEPGSAEAPVKVETAEDIEAAAEQVDTEPSEAQKEAGNYRKAHLDLSGFQVSIENPKGSIRRGKGKDGEWWEVEQPAHYGYIRRTEGADGEQVDVYIGDDPQSERVWVVDQQDPDTKEFDEHKAFIGFESEAQVRDTYDAAYTDRGPERRAAITEMSMDEFKEWLASDRTAKPLEETTEPEGPEVAAAAPVEPVQEEAAGEPAPPPPPPTDETAALPESVQVERTEGEEADRPPSPPRPEVPEGVLVKSDGSPYPSKRAASGAIRGRRLENHEPVEIDGGWGLRPVSRETPVSQETAPETPPVEEPAAPERPGGIPAKPEGFPDVVPSYVRKAFVDGTATSRDLKWMTQKGWLKDSDKVPAGKWKDALTDKGREAQGYLEAQQRGIPIEDYVPRKGVPAPKDEWHDFYGQNDVDGDTWFTTGYAAFKGEAPKGALLLEKPPNIAGVLKPKPGEKVKPVAATYIHYGDNSAVHFDKPDLAIRQDNYDYVVRTYGDGLTWTETGKTGPIMVHRGDELVAAVMPLGGQKNLPGVAAIRGALAEAPAPAKPEKAPEEPKEPAPQPEPEPEPEPQAEAVGTGVEGLALWVSSRLGEGQKIANEALFRAADEAFGGTRGEGKWTPADAYDALEAGVVNHIKASPQLMLGARRGMPPKLLIANLQARIIDLLPTPNARTREKTEFQQFSTPPHYAAAAAWAANIQPDDVVLEPSAGTGMIAVHAGGALGAKNEGNLVLNEFAKRRVDALRQEFPKARIFNEDALQLNKIVSRDKLAPTVVVMNPPFSRTAGRTTRRDTSIGSQHIEAALDRLQPGGRLVAIVGGGMSFDAPTWKPWWKGIQERYNVRANVSVGRDVYRKMGTTFPTRLLVIDKTGPTTGTPVAAQAETVPDVIEALKEVRDDRPEADQPGEVVEPPKDQPDRGGEAGGGRAPAARPPGGERAPTGDVVAPEPRPEQRPEPEPGAGPARPDDRVAPEGPDEGAGRPGAGTREGAGAGEPGGRGRESGVEPVQRDGKPERKPAERDRGVKPKKRKAFSGTNFEPYAPEGATMKGSQEHPTPLVQSAAMSAVTLPATDYQPKLPAKVVKSGALSAAQLEVVTYAGTAHSKFIPGQDGQDTRAGFFVGDSTGVGKAREIAGIIYDNWNQGRKKSVWLSKSNDLFGDARDQLAAVVGDEIPIFPINKVKLDKSLTQPEGIAFVSYGQLRKGIETVLSPERRQEGGPVSVQPTRFAQLKEWLGDDFDGVIAFDESHMMRNATDQKGNRGTKKASDTAKAGIALQREFPKARILYVSATGATEVDNLAYAERLGLWGEGTQFADQTSFTAGIQAGGLAAMEIVARDMKAQGNYIARSLSYEGVQFSRIEHTLTPEQRDMYDQIAGAWRIVLDNINAALEATNQDKSDQLRERARSAFYGSLQRFFNVFMTSLQMPTVFDKIEADIKRGDAVLVQLTNTNQAQQDRSLAQLESGDELDLVDTSPRQSLLEYLERAFPTQQFETYTNEEGNEAVRPVFDSEGKPVQNEQAVRARDDLIRRLAALPVPKGALDLLIDHFGQDKVAEVTGRTQRIVSKRDDAGKMARVREPRTGKASQNEIAAFNEDRKPILVFSEAGGTGASYHADRDFKNQRVRQHYVVQAGWRADTAMQALGRSHRSNQAQPPHYHLVTTDLQGQKRFISSIARRLGQLGALTRGQRTAVGQSLFSERDNLEGRIASDAVHRLFADIVDGTAEDAGIDVETFENETGMTLRNPMGGLAMKLPDMKTFLNRILALPIERQNTVFKAFDERLQAGIAFAEQAGTLDKGVETVVADSITKQDDQIVRVDMESGAETRYVRLQIKKPNPTLPWETLQSRIADRASPPKFFVESKRGNFYIALPTTISRTDPRSGRAVPQMQLLGVNADTRFVDAVNLDNPREWTQTPVDDPAAKRKWDDAFKRQPTHTTADEHLMVGVLLPIWHTIQGGKPVVHRLRTDEGEEFLGRVIPPDLLDETLEAVGLTGVETPQLTAEEAIERVEAGPVKLPNGWELRNVTVGGEGRTEIVGPGADWINTLERAGVIVEVLNFRTRFFVPSGANAQAVTDAVLRSAGVAAAALGATPAKPAFNNKSDEVRDGIFRLARRMNPQVDIALIDRLFHEGPALVASGASSPARREVAGLYYPGRDLIEISLAEQYDPLSAAAHELWHSLEPMLTAAEQRVLQEAFPETDSLTHDERTAYAFQDWHQKELPTGVDAIFRKVKMFLTGIRNLLRGMGFTSPESIFTSAERGDIGARAQKKPIDTASSNFREWFGESKVTRDGAPLQVFHGTGNAFSEFGAPRNPREPGFFFTDSAILAGTYADRGAERPVYPSWTPIAIQQIPGRPNVMPVYLSIKDPYEFDWGGEAYNARRMQNVFDAALGAGHDGIIIKGMRQDVPGNPTVYVAFESTQIKSAANNTGAFDPASADIHASLGQPLRTAYNASWGKVADYVMDRIEAASAPLAPLGRLPEQQKYLAERYRALGDIKRIEEVAATLYDAFRDLPADTQKEVYAFLTDKNAVPGMIQDQEAQHRAVRAKRQIEAVGQALVDYGLLDKATFEEHRGEYLPRIYLRHLLDEKSFQGGGGKTVSDLGYLKERKDIPEDVRKLILGEIEDPAFLTSRAVGKPLRDLAILDFLAKVADGRDWVFEPGMVEWRGKRVSAHWLASEVERIRRQVPHMRDTALRDAASALADKMEAVAAPAIQATGKVPKDFRQIPNSNRYGRLKGMWVRKEIHADIVHGARFLTGEGGIAEKILGHGGYLTKATQLWKLSKVALNPPTQVRNFMSNAVLLNLSGVPMYRMPDRIIQAGLEIAKEGSHYQIAKRYGIGASTFAHNELLRLEKDFTDLQARSGRPLARLKLIGGAVGNFAGDVYGLSETLFKTAKIIDMMEREGATEEEAALAAQKWLFDYSLVTPTTRYLRNAPIGVPFITFYTKALPRLLETAVRHPWRYMPYVVAPMLLAHWITELYDVDDEDLDALRNTLPTWLNEYGASFLPYKDEEGRWQALNWSYFAPWAMYAQVASKLGEGELKEAMTTTGLLGGPVPDLIAAVQTNVDPFTGRKIARDGDPPKQQMISILNYLWGMAGPSWITEQGFAGRMWHAAHGTRAIGREDTGLTTTQTLLRLAGINIYPIDPKQSRDRNLQAMKREIDDTRSALKYRLKQLGRDASPSEKARLREVYKDRIEGLMQRMREYRDETRLAPELR